jgi:hypothetical protein
MGRSRDRWWTMNPTRRRPVLPWRGPTISRLRAFFAPPAVLPTGEPDAAALAAAFAELLAAVRGAGTPEQVRAFEQRLGRALQLEIRRFLSGVLS